MRDREIGKREIEREYVRLFREAYKVATGEMFLDLHDCETPDFIGRDEDERIVGIEITALRFSPGKRHMRRIFPPEPHDVDSWWRLLTLIEKKVQTLLKGRWPECQRKILVIMTIDASIPAVTAGANTETPGAGGFDEIWLADHTQVEPFGAVDLFAVVHPMLKGRFATGDCGQKPYG